MGKYMTLEYTKTGLVIVRYDLVFKGYAIGKGVSETILKAKADLTEQLIKGKVI